MLNSRGTFFKEGTSPRPGGIFLYSTESVKTSELQIFLPSRREKGQSFLHQNRARHGAETYLEWRINSSLYSVSKVFPLATVRYAKWYPTLPFFEKFLARPIDRTS